jgi:hypothetical protein
MMDKIRETWGMDVREGLHLTDLLSPRQAYWKRKHPLPPTDDEIMYFLTGRGHEGEFLKAVGYRHAPTKEWKGIKYSIDYFIEKITELKTRRRGMAAVGEEADVYSHYLKQLRSYAAVEWQLLAELHVWSLLEKQEDNSTKPEFAVYEVEFTDEELVETGRSLLETKELLESCLESGVHTPLPVCEEWMCGKVSRTMKEKPHCLTCARDFETDWGIEKHSQGKKTSDHVTRKAVYDYNFVPRCKWFDLCNPFEGKKVSEQEA